MECQQVIWTLCLPWILLCQAFVCGWKTSLQKLWKNNQSKKNIYISLMLLNNDNGHYTSSTMNDHFMNRCSLSLRPLSTFLCFGAKKCQVLDLLSLVCYSTPAILHYEPSFVHPIWSEIIKWPWFLKAHSWFMPSSWKGFTIMGNFFPKKGVETSREGTPFYGWLIK